jgi:hypothetical protein
VFAKGVHILSRAKEAEVENGREEFIQYSLAQVRFISSLDVEERIVGLRFNQIK